MTRKGLIGAALGVAMLAPVAAMAATAYTNNAVNMRAGPNPEFPLVASLPASAAVEIYGCVEGYTWCDVQAGYNRGWVYADYLSYPYQNQPITVISGGPSIGLPLITFSIGNYWDNYYRGRSWYGNRSYWYGRPANWWYRPAPRYHTPVVRPWPGGHWDHNYRVDNNRYDGNRYNGNRYDGNRYGGNRNDDHRNDYRPPSNRPNHDARPNPGRNPTTANIRDERRSDRPVTGERDQTSQSARTYSQQ
jgi:uncharacterized protein YraI